MSVDFPVGTAVAIIAANATLGLGAGEPNDDEPFTAAAVHHNPATHKGAEMQEALASD